MTNSLVGDHQVEVVDVEEVVLEGSDDMSGAHLKGIVSQIFNFNPRLYGSNGLRN